MLAITVTQFQQHCNTMFLTFDIILTYLPACLLPNMWHLYNQNLWSKPECARYKVPLLPSFIISLARGRFSKKKIGYKKCQRRAHVTKWRTLKTIANAGVNNRGSYCKYLLRFFLIDRPLCKKKRTKWTSKLNQNLVRKNIQMISTPIE